MEEMSGDEVFALVASLIIAAVTAFVWYRPLFTVTPLAGAPRNRLILGFLPILAVLAVLPVLRHFAAAEVRSNETYIFLFVAVGAALMGTAMVFTPLVGISARDDAIERGNGAAAVALCGLITGVAFCYAGSNIGEGPTIWETIVPAICSVATLFAVWMIVATISGVMAAITIDRDVASAIRLAAFLAGAGLVFGRAMSGDFKSPEATARDFIFIGWPVVPLAMVIVLCQRSLRPTPARPQPAIGMAGILPGALLFLASLLYVSILGLPAHFKD